MENHNHEMVSEQKSTSESQGKSSENSKCGICGWNPSFLQVFNGPKTMLFWLSWFALVQGFAVNGITNVIASSLERRFNLHSSQSALVASAYDFSAGALVLIVTYLGTHAHQPRLLSGACAAMALGSFIMTIPHFVTGLYELGDATSGQCETPVNGTTSNCDSRGNSELSNYLYVLILGQLLHGVGGTTLYTIGVVFIDSNVDVKTSPLYQGIFYTFAAGGPAIGYLAGGLFLNQYVDFDMVSSTDLGITPNDPRWVGAWWVGYAVSGAAAIPVAFALAWYPRQLPSADAAYEHRESQVHQQKVGADSRAYSSDFLRSVRDLPVAVKTLFTNSVLVCVTVAGITEGIAIAGISTFVPKYIENYFNKTSSEAAFIAGALAVSGAALGELGGGSLCKFLKLKVRGMLNLVLISAIVSAIASAAFFAKCDSLPLAGVTRPYDEANSTVVPFVIQAECISNCGCTTNSYEPVCGADSLQYFSACHAGCLNSTTVDGVTVFGDCSCIKNAVNPNNLAPGFARAGICNTTCLNFYTFCVLGFILVLFAFLLHVPALSVTLRCLPDVERAFGFGMKWFFVRLLGTVPGPVIYGAVFDSTCSLYRSDGCSDRLSCWFYDSTNLSVRLGLVTLGLQSISVIAFAAARFFYVPPPEKTLENAEPNLERLPSKA